MILNDHQDHYLLVLLLQRLRLNLLKNSHNNVLLFLHRQDQFHQQQIVLLVGEQRIKIVLWKNTANMPVDKNHYIKNLNGLLKALINYSSEKKQNCFYLRVLNDVKNKKLFYFFYYIIIDGVFIGYI